MYWFGGKQRAGVGLMAMIALVVVAGCGSKGIPVSGEVTFDGKPVEEGTISFEPADGQGPSTGGKIVDGQYHLTGDAAPLPGKKTVRIFAARKTGRKILAGPPFPQDKMIDEIVRYIPDMYNKKTTLSCEISGQGENRFDFHLKSP